MNIYFYHRWTDLSRCVDHRLRIGIQQILIGMVRMKVLRFAGFHRDQFQCVVPIPISFLFEQVTWILRSMTILMDKHESG